MEQFLGAMLEIEFQVDFKTSVNQNYFSIDSANISSGKEICFDLTFFHYFTGADSTSHSLSFQERTDIDEFSIGEYSE